MAKNRPRDESAPPESPPPADSDSESLLTSQDIFGEILDSFGAPSTPSEDDASRPPPSRKDPIRIRVSEPGVSPSAPKKSVRLEALKQLGAK